MTIHWKAVEQYFTVVLFLFQLYAVCYFAKNSTILDLALSRVKRFTNLIRRLPGVSGLVFLEGLVSRPFSSSACRISLWRRSTYAKNTAPVPKPSSDKVYNLFYECF